MWKRLMMVFGVTAWLLLWPIRAEAKELVREETEIEVDYGEADNVTYYEAEGELDGWSYRLNPADGLWLGNWYNALSVTKVVTRVYLEDGKETTETERVKIPCFDESTFNMTTYKSEYPDDYYVLKGADPMDYGSYRIMQYNPDPLSLTELTVIYGGKEYPIDYDPVRAEIIGYEVDYYTVMLRDMKDAAFYVDVYKGDYYPEYGEAFASMDLDGFRQYYVFNHYDIKGYMFDEDFNLVISGLELKGFYGMKEGTRFDSSTLKPAVRGRILCRSRNEFGNGKYGVEAAIFPDWELSFDEVEEGYELVVSDNYRSFSGKLTEENGTEHPIEVIVGVKGPDLYASYVVSIPAAVELSEGEDGFSGEMEFTVSISSNNEDFYVSVVPQELVVTGELTGEAFPVQASAERSRYRISDETMEGNEDVFRDTGRILLSTEGLPERADTYVGVLTILISSGTEQGI